MMRLAAALFALLVLAPAPARGQELFQQLAEAERVARLEQALAKDPVLRPYTFRVTAERAVVTVEGTVRAAEERQRIEAVAGNIGEIGSLVNRVQVEGGPPIAASQTAPPPAADAAPSTPAPAASAPAAQPEPAAAEPEAAPAPQPEATYHRVRRGDTLGKIARQYGTSVRAVQQLNNLRSTNIRVGQRLRVK